MFFKPQAFFLRTAWQQKAAASMLYQRAIVSSQQRSFVKSMEERKED